MAKSFDNPFRPGAGHMPPHFDADFFAGRWTREKDRQREPLEVIARLESSSSHANQMLSSLMESGLVYKNRHGRYSLAVPLLGRYIRRQIEQRDAECRSRC